MSKMFRNSVVDKIANSGKVYRDDLFPVAVYQDGEVKTGEPVYFIGKPGYSGKVRTFLPCRDFYGNDAKAVQARLDSYAKDNGMPVVGNEPNEYITSRIFVNFYDALVVREIPGTDKWAIYALGHDSSYQREFMPDTANTNVYDTARDAFSAILEYTKSCHGNVYVNDGSAGESYLDSIADDNHIPDDIHEIFNLWILEQLNLKETEDIWGSLKEIDSLAPQFMEVYEGKWNSKSDFAYVVMNERMATNGMGSLDDLPTALLDNIDWDGVADSLKDEGYNIVTLYDYSVVVFRDE